MEARESNILKFLTLDNHQFVIPVYQRTYKWTRLNCKTNLLLDILKASNPKNKTHFLGSIVYITDEHYQATQVNKLSITRWTTKTHNYIFVAYGYGEIFGGTFSINFKQHLLKY